MVGVTYELRLLKWGLDSVTSMLVVCDSSSLKVKEDTLASRAKGTTVYTAVYCLLFCGVRVRPSHSFTPGKNTKHTAHTGIYIYIFTYCLFIIYVYFLNMHYI